MKTNLIQKNRQAFTLIELMVVILSISLLASTAFAAYSNYVKRSKTAEVSAILTQIANLQYDYFLANGAFAETGPTNIPPPGGQSTSVDFLANPAENWSAIRFDVKDPVRYGYRCYQNGSPASHICEAQGDLDGDGDISIFSIQIDVNTDGEPTRTGISSFDELE